MMTTSPPSYFSLLSHDHLLYYHCHATTIFFFTITWLFSPPLLQCHHYATTKGDHFRFGSVFIKKSNQTKI
jgi:hypothetical protein